MLARVHNIPSFDASKEESRLITFTWDDVTTKITYLRCIIKIDSWKGQTIYQKTISYSNETGVFEFELLPFSQDAEPYTQKLLNGHKYFLWILGNNSDEFDDPLNYDSFVAFDCLSSPSIRFTNLDGSVDKYGNYVFNMIYHQEENREINTLKLLIRRGIQSESVEYDINSASDVIVYDNNNAEITYTVPNLSNEQVYYVRAVGSCVGGIEFDTGSWLFTPQSGEYQPYHFILATNLPEDGGIRIETDIASIKGLLFDKNDNLIPTEDLQNGAFIPDVIRPIKDGEKIMDTIDLTNHYLVYNQGFVFQKDWAFLVVCSHMKQNQEILRFEYMDASGKTITNPNLTGRLYYRIGYNGNNVRRPFFEYEVTRTYTGTNVDNTIYNVSTKRRFFSKQAPDVMWNHYNDSSYIWKDFVDNNVTWQDVLDGNNVDRNYYVKISRINNYYKIEVKVFDTETGAIETTDVIDVPTNGI